MRGLLDRLWTWLCQLLSVRKSGDGAAQSEQGTVSRVGSESVNPPPLPTEPCKKEASSSPESASPARQQGQGTPPAAPPDKVSPTEGTGAEETSAIPTDGTAVLPTTETGQEERTDGGKPEAERKEDAPRKPRVKKPPTAVTPPRKDSTPSAGQKDQKQTRPPIELGKKERKPQRPARKQGQEAHDNGGKATGTDSNRTRATRILAPFVEFGLKDAKVHLVLPERAIGDQQPETAHQKCHLSCFHKRECPPSRGEAAAPPRRLLQSGTA